MKDQVLKQSKAVATNIKKIRQFRGYTQDYVAAKLGISQNAYSKIELGYSRFGLEKLFHLAIILEVEATQLIGFKAEDLVFVLRQIEQ